MHLAVLVHQLMPFFAPEVAVEEAIAKVTAHRCRYFHYHETHYVRYSLHPKHDAYSGLHSLPNNDPTCL